MWNAMLDALIISVKHSCFVWGLSSSWKWVWLQGNIFFQEDYIGFKSRKQRKQIKLFCFLKKNSGVKIISPLILIRNIIVYEKLLFNSSWGNGQTLTKWIVLGKKKILSYFQSFA